MHFYLLYVFLLPLDPRILLSLDMLVGNLDLPVSIVFHCLTERPIVDLIFLIFFPRVLSSSFIGSSLSVMAPDLKTSSFLLLSALLL